MIYSVYDNMYKSTDTLFNESISEIDRLLENYICINESNTNGKSSIIGRIIDAIKRAIEFLDKKITEAKKRVKEFISKGIFRKRLGQINPEKLTASEYKLDIWDGEKIQKELDNIRRKNPYINYDVIASLSTGLKDIDDSIECGWFDEKLKELENKLKNAPSAIEFEKSFMNNKEEYMLHKTYSKQEVKDIVEKYGIYKSDESYKIDNIEKVLGFPIRKPAYDFMIKGFKDDLSELTNLQKTITNLDEDIKSKQKDIIPKVEKIAIETSKELTAFIKVYGYIVDNCNITKAAFEFIRMLENNVKD